MGTQDASKAREVLVSLESPLGGSQRRAALLQIQRVCAAGIRFMEDSISRLGRMIAGERHEIGPWADEEWETLSLFVKYVRGHKLNQLKPVVEMKNFDFSGDAKDRTALRSLIHDIKRAKAPLPRIGLKFIPSASERRQDWLRDSNNKPFELDAEKLMDAINKSLHHFGTTSSSSRRKEDLQDLGVVIKCLDESEAVCQKPGTEASEAFQLFCSHPSEKFPEWMGLRFPLLKAPSGVNTLNWKSLAFLTETNVFPADSDFIRNNDLVSLFKLELGSIVAVAGWAATLHTLTRFSNLRSALEKNPGGGSRPLSSYQFVCDLILATMGTALASRPHLKAALLQHLPLDFAEVDKARVEQAFSRPLEWFKSQKYIWNKGDEFYRKRGQRRPNQRAGVVESYNPSTPFRYRP